MRVGIATDHGGFELKEDLLAQLKAPRCSDSVAELELVVAPTAR